MMAQGILKKYRDNQKLANKSRRSQLARILRSKDTSSYSWCGDLLGTHTGVFLQSELDIEKISLSACQIIQLEKDIISISLDSRTIVRNKAKHNIKNTQKILSKLKHLESAVQNLSPELWTQKAQKIDCNPAFSLLDLQIKLEEHLYLANQEIKVLGVNKSNITSRALCISAILIWVRWKGDFNSEEDRGVAYPEDWKSMITISKSEGKSKSSDATSELAIFLENCTIELGKSSKIWEFEYWDPSLEAKAKLIKQDLSDIQ